MIRRRTFRAMGSEVVLLVEAPALAAEAVFDASRREVTRLEGLLSRFSPASELSMLNRRGRLRAGPDLTRVTRAALRARRDTRGGFDPTVLPALRAAGYDRDLAAVKAADTGPAGAPVPAGGEVTIEPTGEIVLGDGVQLDLGGIAKGDAADRLARILATAGPGMAVVGGDLAVSGPRRDGSPWPVAVDGAGDLVLAVAGGGVATSGTDRRRWSRGGHVQHHVIDPRTGAPSTTDLTRVSVAAASATSAEVLATELLLLGSVAARERADALGVPAVLVDHAGPMLVGGLA